MTHTIRNRAFALALLGGLGLFAAPASANSIQEEGNFGGTWSRIGPNESDRDRADRYYAPGTYAAPSYYPGNYDYDGPGVIIAPGVGFRVDAY